MSYFLALQATYHSLEYALYDGMRLIQKKSLIKTQASSLLMCELNQLLSDHNCTWHDIQFLAVNQGPAPFTTLRALIATVNGISFATHKPLIGIDGLAAFAHEYKSDAVTLNILNAFS